MRVTIGVSTPCRRMLVRSGKLKALTTSDAGDDVVFSILGSNEVFGEIALLGGSERTATVTAIDPCELLPYSAKRRLLDTLSSIYMVGLYGGQQHGDEVDRR